MPDDDRARALDAFIAELNGAWKAAGPPTYAVLEEMSRRLESDSRQVFGVRVIALPRSTVNDLLNCRRRRVPRWQLVASFWAVLRVIAIEGSVDPDRLGALGEWRRRYEAIDPHRHGAVARRPAGDAEEARRARLLALTERAAGLAWWSAYRDVVPEWFENYLSLERDASVVQIYEPRFVPGLLQTEDYARATIAGGGAGAAPAEVARRVELRMRRQEILRRPDAPQVRATIDERVLRPGAGPRGAGMRAQIEHLIEVAALPHVRLQVIPAGAAGAAVVDGPVTHLRFPERDIPDVVYLEQRAYGLYPEKSKDVKHFRGALGRLARAAECPEASVARLRRMIGGS